MIINKQMYYVDPFFNKMKQRCYNCCFCHLINLQVSFDMNVEFFLIVRYYRRKKDCQLTKIFC